MKRRICAQGMIIDAEVEGLKVAVEDLSLRVVSAEKIIEEKDEV